MSREEDNNYIFFFFVEIYRVKGFQGCTIFLCSIVRPPSGNQAFKFLHSDNNRCLYARKYIFFVFSTTYLRTSLVLTND